MSWRGVKKSISRLPHQFKTRNGDEDVTRDLEYLGLESRYKELVKCSDELRLETMAFRDGLAGMLYYQLQCANHLAEAYGLVIEDDRSMLESECNAPPIRLPIKEATDIPPATKQALEDYATAMAYCREETMSLLDDLDAFVIRPADHFQMITKIIDKTITKRQHKLIDFDRHRISYMKYSALVDPSPSEEKNMFKLQAQFDNAAHDYDYFNNMLKDDLVRFLDLSQEFIDPIMQNFFNIQCCIMGGFYGRLHEVIQHNQSLFPTLDMSVDEGFTFRLSQRSARHELDNTDLLKKGLKPWERRGSIMKDGASSTYCRPSYQQDDNSNDDYLSTQGHPSMNRSLSNQSSNSSLSSSGRRLSVSSSSYNNNNSSIPPTDNNYNTTTDRRYSSAPAPPPLSRKPSLSPRPSYMGITKNVVNTPPPIRRPSISSVKQDMSTAYSNVHRANNIMEKHQQGKAISMSDVKFGYEMSKNISSASSAASSYHSAIMTSQSSNPSTPPREAERSTGYRRNTISTCTSPFVGQQQVLKKKRAPPPPPPPRGTSAKKEYVEALYKLKAPQDGDLSFSVGDRIEILEKSDKYHDWWKGRIGNQVGMFPANYVRQV